MNRARPSGEEERIVGAAAAVRQNHLSCGRAEYSARAQVEAGMVPWASDRLFDDKTANKWRAVVRAERTNGEQSAGAPDKQDGFDDCMALQHGHFGKRSEERSEGKGWVTRWRYRLGPESSKKK